ncbi:MAG: hypothetical protein CMM50_15315 [Rhodospirillaceae bacterium]|nr:hypothetical protein [Rhodospirillaceae bacterium]
MARQNYEKVVAAMFDHPIIDIALGLILFYVVLSLVASAVQEWVASLFALRSKNLRSGIQTLIGDELAQKVYMHPLIKNLAKRDKLPSYIAPKTLSTVLLEVISKENGGKSYATCTADEVLGIVDRIYEGNPVKAILNALIDGGEDAPDVLKDRLAGWFDEGMARISGWYKRQASLVIFIVAAVVTVATNADSIHMAEELWQNDALRTQIAAQAQAAAQKGDVSELEGDALEGLESFPIGWEVVPECGTDWLKSILGWLITIAAVSLGAPFWFDLLGKVANLKGAGGKPKS